MMGSLRIELTSADISGTLQCLQDAGILLSDAEMIDAFVIRFCLAKADWKKFRKITIKRGEQARIVQKSGLYWTVTGLLHRPVLLIGIAILLLLTLWIPSRVFFVQVEGNSAIPAKQIVEAAAECGLCFGASREDVRSEIMKNALLSAMPELQWAGVNTYGCVAVITVRERKDQLQAEVTTGVSSIVASRDGVIREILTTRGIAICSKGQAVKAGQVLISGYNDCGIYIQATQAEGEVYAETTRNLTALTPCIYRQKVKIMVSEKKYSLIIGKKRINFYNSSGILGTTCAKIYTENYLTLPGGFVLPCAIITEEWITYETVDGVSSTAEKLLQDFAGDYLQSQMNAGKVVNACEVFTQLADVCRLDGVYSCYEMIGLSRPEENLTDYEND